MMYVVSHTIVNVKKSIYDNAYKFQTLVVQYDQPIVNLN